jgi:hypothetical protein
LRGCLGDNGDLTKLVMGALYRSDPIPFGIGVCRSGGHSSVGAAQVGIEMDTTASLPDVPDMVDAGLPLWAAFALWSEMMSSEKRDATYWWRLPQEPIGQ